MPERDETLPRQSDLFSFIGKEEFDAIPRYILDEKSKEGTLKHAILESTFGKEGRDNILANMFKDGVKLLFGDPAALDEKPIFEEQLNGALFTGAPDFVWANTIIDYKFTNELRPKVALQLVAYAMLIFELKGKSIDRHYAFHYPNDRSLFIHKVPDRTVPALVKFINFVIKNHESIKAGKMAKYDALIQWTHLQQDYDMFEYVQNVLPPITITNDEQALKAARIYVECKKAEDKVKEVKAELMRYLIENPDADLVDEYGYGVKLQNGPTQKIYNEKKKAVAKAIYDKALSECIEGTKKTKIVKRVKPSNRRLN